MSTPYIESKIDAGWGCPVFDDELYFFLGFPFRALEQRRVWPKKD